ncbi:MAG: hypothetical protein M3326_07125 [Actinomycetota bacterium]|nr:hypothetical protein [Actinomycetota bacterium]
MTFVVALLCWFLLSMPAAMIIGRIIEGPVAHRSAPVAGPSWRTARPRFPRS